MTLCHASPIPLQARVGLVRYSTNAIVELPLGQFSTYCSAADRVARIVYDAGATATSVGIANATQQFTTHGRRASLAVPKVMVVITDGLSTTGCLLAGFNATTCPLASTLWAADQARRAGITVMVVSIGSAANENPGGSVS